MFTDKLRQEEATKSAMGQLAASSIQGIKSREQYEKAYGEGSVYKDYLKSQAEQMKAMTEHLGNLKLGS
jgi:hypothetical protein